ncbi:MAG: hypothetical protein KF740_08345 [Ramlibacter sp.]|nr:hypothetical protein [Ramlibacter sp.]
MSGLRISSAHFKLGAWVTFAWLLGGVFSWIFIGPPAPLVGARESRNHVAAELAQALARPVIAVDLAALERVKLWGMERNGQPSAPPQQPGTVEKKIPWNVTAQVVRGNERYLVLFQPESKAIQQVRVGEKMPDGTKLLSVELNSFTVRLPNGKKRTTELHG